MVQVAQHLKQFSGKPCVPLEVLVETRNATAVLCYKCEKVLNSIDSLSAKIESLKADVRARGSSLQRVQSGWDA